MTHEKLHRSNILALIVANLPNQRKYENNACLKSVQEDCITVGANKSFNCLQHNKLPLLLGNFPSFAGNQQLCVEKCKHDFFSKYPCLIRLIVSKCQVIITKLINPRTIPQLVFDWSQFQLEGQSVLKILGFKKNSDHRPILIWSIYFKTALCSITRISIKR